MADTGGGLAVVTRRTGQGRCGDLSRSQAGQAMVGSVAISTTYLVTTYSRQPELRGRVIAGVLA